MDHTVLPADYIMPGSSADDSHKVCDCEECFVSRFNFKLTSVRDSSSLSLHD